jgi:hypothetical protein
VFANPIVLVFIAPPRSDWSHFARRRFSETRYTKAAERKRLAGPGIAKLVEGGW